MKINKFLFKYIAIYSILIIGLAYTIPTQIDWSRTYENGDKIPFGTFILFNEINRVFNDLTIRKETIYNSFKNDSTTLSNQIFITEKFALNDLDLKYLLRGVQKGNNVFIAAKSISNNLLDSLSIEIEQVFPKYELNNMLISPFSDTIHLCFNDIELNAEYIIESEIFKSIVLSDSKQNISLLSDNLGNDYFYECNFGDGKIFIFILPHVFSNYMMLKPKNMNLASIVLSHLPDRFTIWDDYYKSNNLNSRNTPFVEILSRPSLAWAFYLTILSLFLFLIFKIKREQRIIEEIIPYKNQSLEFVRTIGNLYFFKKNNKDVGQKKIRFLKEFILSKYYLTNIEFNDELISNLIAKSSSSEDIITAMVNEIISFESERFISETQLMTLINKINNFYGK